MQALRSGWRRALTFLGKWLDDFIERNSGTGLSTRFRPDRTRPKATVDREITPQEAAVVRWLLDHSDISEVSAYTGTSTGSLRVLGECTCGCRSIDFAQDTGGADIISDALAVYPDRQEAEIILWGRDGHVVALEVVDHTEGTSGRLPQLSDLRTWEQRGRELAGEGSA